MQNARDSTLHEDARGKTQDDIFATLGNLGLIIFAGHVAVWRLFAVFCLASALKLFDHVIRAGEPRDWGDHVTMCT